MRGGHLARARRGLALCLKFLKMPGQFLVSYSMFCIWISVLSHVRLGVRNSENTYDAIGTGGCVVSRPSGCHME